MALIVVHQYKNTRVKVSIIGSKLKCPLPSSSPPPKILAPKAKCVFHLSILVKQTH